MALHAFELLQNLSASQITFFLRRRVVSRRIRTRKLITCTMLMQRYTRMFLAKRELRRLRRWSASVKILCAYRAFAIRRKRIKIFNQCACQIIVKFIKICIHKKRMSAASMIRRFLFIFLFCQYIIINQTV